MALTIAIDGPVGAGKSAIAAALSKALGILHLDTGAMYRAFGLKVLRAGIDPKDAQAVEALVVDTDIAVRYVQGAQRTLLDGEDVTADIRTPPVSDAASAVSMAPGVRRYLVQRQRQYAREEGVIMDGRDIGTHVLPDAACKFYLDARAETRAMRRHQENLARGIPSDYDAVLAALIARDRQDMERAESPLRVADDAEVVDTTDMNQEEVLAWLLRAVQTRRDA